ncbi:MAG TPA: TonB-dependent receptor [Hydrogenothermaceae bacterium]|nr:TonB-dependent receptor [Hydrogenothermaceae bacterium]
MKKIFLSFILIPVLAYSEGIIKLEKIKKKLTIKDNNIKQLYKEEIQNAGINDIGKILEQYVSEINSIRKGGIFNDIVLRGFYRDNINVLVDNSKIFGACPNRMDPPVSKVSSVEIEKIEVQKGSFDVENQGSLAGTINIKTVEPSKDKKININLTVGSFSYFKGSTLISGGNDKVSLLLVYEKSYSKPYKTGEGKKFTEYKHPKPENDYQFNEINRKAYDIDNISTGIKLELNDENKILVKVGYQKAESVLYPYLKMDTVYDHTYKANIFYTQKYLNIEALIYFNSTYHDMQDKWRNSAISWTDGTNSTRGYMMRTIAKAKTYGFSIKKSFRISNIDIKTGIDGYIRNWRADNIIMNNDNKGMIPNVYIKNIGAFLKLRKNFSKNIITAGIRYDISYSQADKNNLGTSNKTLYNEYYLNNYDLSKTDAYFSGFFKYEYKPTKKVFLFSGIGTTVRVPDPQERYIALRKPMTNPDWIGNPNLKPPKNTELDIGAKYINKNLKFETTTFYSYVNNYIYLTKITATKQATSYQNIDAKFYGFDFSAIYNIKGFYFVEFGGAYQIGKKTSGEDKDIAEIPPLKLRASINFDDTQKFARLDIIHAFKQTKVDSTLNEQETSEWTTINIKGGYKYKNFSFISGINNLFNQTYYTHLSYLRDPFSTGMKVPELGRFIYISVVSKF